MDVMRLGLPMQPAAVEEESSRPVIKPSGITVTEAPKFELEQYISNYAAPTRIERLVHIGLSSKVLGLEALRLAVSEAKKGKDVNKYIAIAELYATKAPDDSQAAPDNEWAERKQLQLDAETNRLEQELKGYKNNLIKESIRMGNEDLGNHYFSVGDLANASKAYNRMRDQCTTPKHMCDMTLRILLTATVQENWMTVQQSIRKISEFQLKKEEKSKIEPLIAPVEGLANLCSGKYKQAAESFLDSLPEYQTMDPVAGNPSINFQRQVMSANDIAVYGALTALATLTREELQIRILENTAFRTFLELEPHLRRAIAAFVSSKFTTTLSILASYKTDYLLDIHLGKHVEELYSSIRRKSIIAYVKPFNRISIEQLATAFSAPSGDEMTEELIDLIEEGHLPAFRIDAVGGILEAVEKDQRLATFEQAMRIADEVENDLRLRLFRINCQQAGFEIRKPEFRQSGAGGAPSGKGQRVGA